MFLLDKNEISALKEHGEAFRDQLIALLTDCGVNNKNLALLRQKFPLKAKKRFAFLYTGSAIALQRHAGHNVRHVSSYLAKDRNWFRAMFEIEDNRAGINADRIALLLLSEVIPEFEYSLEGARETASISDVIRHYRSRSEKTVLPADTRELIAAAERAGVPWIKMDPAFFNVYKGRFRTRDQSPLLLGQGIHRHIVDGTLCVDRGQAALPFLKDRISIVHKLHTLDIPQPHINGAPEICHTLLQGVLATESLGYPVVIKPVRRRHGEGVTKGVRNVEELMKAVQQAQKVSRQFFVERLVKGGTWLLIIAAHEVVGMISETGAEESIDEVHVSTLKKAQAISHEMNVGMMVLSVVTRDIRQALESNDGAIVDLDLAPQLDRILPQGSPLWEKVADGFIHWLYPPEAPSRIPIIAVTGTNGKTTTSRMITRIMQCAGFKTGLACSEGVYLNEDRIKGHSNKNYIKGMFHRLLANRHIELAVMECFLSRLKSKGFSFDWCNVGVMTNVTADHLQPGWETVERLAEIKRSVLERARDGVVLNADDPNTEEMLPHLSARKVALTSVRQSLEEIQHSGLSCDIYVLVEPVEGSDRIIIFDDGQRQDLMAVADIPACFGGKALFNLENALQAIATGHLMGVDKSVLNEAMTSFEASYEHTPGRLNIYQEHSFRVIMDYAHNGDGIQKLCAFTDQLEVTGRRILMFAVTGDRQDEEIEATMLAAAGHFDHYVCRNYPNVRGLSRAELPQIMRGILEKVGVSEEQITVSEDASEAVDLALNMARENDLLVMTPGMFEMEEMWQRIQAGPQSEL